MKTNHSQWLSASALWRVLSKLSPPAKRYQKHWHKETWAWIRVFVFIICLLRWSSYHALQNMCLIFREGFYIYRTNYFGMPMTFKVVSLKLAQKLRVTRAQNNFCACKGKCVQRGRRFANAPKRSNQSQINFYIFLCLDTYMYILYTYIYIFLTYRPSWNLLYNARLGWISMVGCLPWNRTMDLLAFKTTETLGAESLS